MGQVWKWPHAFAHILEPLWSHLQEMLGSAVWPWGQQKRRTWWSATGICHSTYCEEGPRNRTLSPRRVGGLKMCLQTLERSLCEREDHLCWCHFRGQKQNLWMERSIFRACWNFRHEDGCAFLLSVLHLSSDSWCQVWGTDILLVHSVCVCVPGILLCKHTSCLILEFWK